MKIKKNVRKAIYRAVKSRRSHLMSVADPYPELADGDDLLVRVGGGRLVKVSPHHVYVVGQGPQVVVRLLTYHYDQADRKTGVADPDPH
jgi:hypothetical protein